MTTEVRSAYEVAKYIERLLKEKNMKPVDLANRAGVDKSTISRYFRGTRKIPMDELAKFADALNVDPVELLIDNGDNNKTFLVHEESAPYNLVEVPESSFVKIPIIGTIACGDPIIAEQNIEGYTYETSDSLPHGSIFALKAKGDSMSPTIPDGATVIIREQSDVENKEIAAVLVNGDNEATLKRIEKFGDVVILKPDNPAHPTILIDEENPARIIGKAVGFRVNL